MKEIQLTQGKTAQVDNDDFDRLNLHKWYVMKNCKTYYAARFITINGKEKTFRMHHAIMGKVQGLQTDHKDGNGLNNQKGNLRFVTVRQNAQNRKNIYKTSQYPGVCWDGDRDKWRSTIKINDKYKHIGRYVSEADAFIAYRNAVSSIGETVVI